MKRIVLGMLPHLLGSGCAVEATATSESNDQEGMQYFKPTFRYLKPKENWQGSGKRSKPRNK